MSEVKARRPKVVTLPPGLDSLLSRKQVCVALGGLSMRSFERMVSSGEFPSLDMRVGSMPRWKVSTFNRWIDAQGEK
jgi:predicted DNA-binding transcriptional regulator AlpA